MLSTDMYPNKINDTLQLAGCTVRRTADKFHSTTQSSFAGMRVGRAVFGGLYSNKLLDTEEKQTFTSHFFTVHSVATTCSAIP